jgi:hypothetical protein
MFWWFGEGHTMSVIWYIIGLLIASTLIVNGQAARREQAIKRV